MASNTKIFKFESHDRWENRGGPFRGKLRKTIRDAAGFMQESLNCRIGGNSNLGLPNLPKYYKIEDQRVSNFPFAETSEPVALTISLNFANSYTIYNHNLSTQKIISLSPLVFRTFIETLLAVCGSIFTFLVPFLLSKEPPSLIQLIIQQ